MKKRIARLSLVILLLGLFSPEVVQANSATPSSLDLLPFADASSGLTAKMVKDIAPGSASSAPTELTNVNGTLYLVADDGVNGAKVWKSNGTTAELVPQCPGGPPGYNSPSELTTVNGRLYFVADNARGRGLFMLRGGCAGEIPYAGGTHNPDIPSNLTAVNGWLFFADAFENSHALFKLDNSVPEPSPVLVKIITPPILGTSVPGPSELTNVNGILYFVANDGVHGTELWKSDGTDAGTKRVIDAAGGGAEPSFKNSRELTNVSGKLYFAAITVKPPTMGDRLWETDGTPSGTKDVSTWGNPSNITQLTEANGTLAYVWVDCGTGSSTCTELKPLGFYSTRGYGGFLPQFSNLTNVNGALFFVLTDTVLRDNTVHTRRQLWMNKTLVGDIPGGEFNAPTNFAAMNGKLYFVANDGINGAELWMNDGTAAGTMMIADIASGSGSSNPSKLANVNGILFFAANDGVHGNELWRTVVDNTPPTTTINLSGTLGNNGWYRSNVQATLTATDNPGGSGVNKTQYSLNGIAWNTYSAPFPVSTEGITTVSYRSTDKTGNVENTKTQAIKIDKTPPTISVISPQAQDYSQTAKVNVNWRVKDGLKPGEQSGVATESGILDNKTAVTNGQVLNLSSLSLGSHIVTVKVSDNAGNTASVSVTFKVVADNGIKSIRDDATGGDCASIGVWNSMTKTCKLTKDLGGAVEIASNLVTLDGNRRTLAGGNSGNGVSIVGRTGVTIKDLKVKGFQYGIFLQSSTKTTLTGLDISGATATGIAFRSASTYNTTTHTTLTNNLIGIDVGDQGSHHNTFEHMVVHSNTRTGFQAYAGSDYTRILSSRFYNNGGGGGQGTWAGILLGWSSNWSIENCVVYSNKGDGISLDTVRDGTIKNSMIHSNGSSGIGYAGLATTNNLAIRNWVYSNSVGLGFWSYARNNIARENFIHNNSTGILISKNDTGPNYDNLFYNNTLIGNTKAARVQEDRYTNKWDNGLPAGGNYWSDYHTPSQGCKDLNHNHLCDAPYVSDGVRDNYPWLIPGGWLIPIFK